MIVVSDTSPLTALLTIEAADILPKLFQEIIIPEEVRDELVRSHSPLPTWLRVERVKNSSQVMRYTRTVDAGEAEAITVTSHTWPCERVCFRVRLFRGV
jgi:predicted nucleic acid-binding protein